MRYIFLLSGDYIALGKEEATSLFDIRSSKLMSHLLIADLDKNGKSLNGISQKLALTKGIYKLLFECEAERLVDLMKDYDWNSVYKGSFCLRAHHFDGNIKDSKGKQPYNKKMKNNQKNFSERDLSGYVWHSLRSPKVDLDSPKTKIELFLIKDRVYCGLLIYENRENFEPRKSHLRPFSSPSSLHPKLARALVNLTGIKKNESLLDPFCGSGGFLLEAGLMKIKTVGYDISRNEVEGCKENLRYFKIKDYKIINENALKIKEKADCVATDLPYGLNSNAYLQHYKNSINQENNKISLKTNKKTAIKNLEQFYLQFLKNLRKILKKKAVIVFPSYVGYRILLKTAKFKIEKEFSIPVHRSLTRKILKIE